MPRKIGSVCVALLALVLGSCLVEAKVGTDPSHLETVVTLSFENKPLSVGISEARNRVYIGDDTGFHVVDGDTDEIIDHITLDFEVEMIVVNPANDNIFVSGWRPISTTYVLDGDSYAQIGTLPESLYGPDELAVNPVTNMLYMADNSATMGVPDYVRVYDGSSLTQIASVEIPGSRDHPYIEAVYVAVNPQTNLAYAAWSWNENVHLINCTTHEIVAQVKPTSYGPPLVNPTTGFVYVGSSVLNGTSLTEVNSLSWSPDAVNPDDNLVMWGTDYDSGVYILDGSSHEILVSHWLEWDIDNVAVNVATGKIYVIHEWDKRVSIVQEVSGPYDHLIVNEVELNPPGEDKGFLEWVELYNPTSLPVEIGGLNLRCDTRGWHRPLPSGITLEPGDYYTFAPSHDYEWLDNVEETVEIVDTSSSPWRIVNRVSFKTDLLDDESTWQRYPDGTDLWEFQQATPEYGNITELRHFGIFVPIMAGIASLVILLRKRILSV